MTTLHLDSKVRIKLTPHGRACLQHQDEALLYARGKPWPWPQEDADGYSTWTLRALILRLGPKMEPLAPALFEGEMFFLDDGK